ncbi:MAG: hypothetical protein ACOC56_00440 [Atribacterota bacterium]
MAEDKKEEQRKIAVVSELPQTTVRVAEDENGERYDLITKEEAITEMLESIREIKKGLVG